MFQRLFDSIRRRLRRRQRLGGAQGRAPGEWLAAVYAEPSSDSFMVLGRRNLHYRLYLPSRIGKTEKLPLLLMLHGCGQSAVEFAEGTRMNALAEERRCAVLYPQQSREYNALRCWNWFTPEVLAGRGEAALIVDTLHHIRGRYPIDAARMYVAGLSAGGAMAAVLCATHGNLFAACAIHSGVMFHAATTASEAMQVMRGAAVESIEASVQRIVKERPSETRLVPTLIMHGSEDRTVDPVNAERMVEQIRLLAQVGNPSGGPATLRKERWLDAGGHRSRQQDLTQGSALLARSIIVEGLGHAWSGGDARYKFFDSAGPEASEIVIEFFSKHRLPADLAGDAATIRASDESLSATL